MRKYSPDPNGTGGVLSFLHYKLETNGANDFWMWDRYNWTEADPAKW